MVWETWLQNTGYDIASKYSIDMTPYIEHIGGKHCKTLTWHHIYIEHIVASRQFHVSTLSSINMQHTLQPSWWWSITLQCNDVYIPIYQLYLFKLVKCICFTLPAVFLSESDSTSSHHMQLLARQRWYYRSINSSIHIGRRSRGLMINHLLLDGDTCLLLVTKRCRTGGKTRAMSMTQLLGGTFAW